MIMNNIHINIIEALYYKINSINRKYKISSPRFKSLFNISPTFYLYNYSSSLENEIYNLYGESKSLDKYMDIIALIKCFITLIYSSPNDNSEENEYVNTFSFLNIININRSQIEKKYIIKNKLFRSFLFTSPSSEGMINRSYLAASGVLNKKKNINQALYELINLSNNVIKTKEHQRDVVVINHIINAAYDYLIGKRLTMPYYKNMDIYAYYFFNPLDFINLYKFERCEFYKLLDECAINDDSFMKKSFIYNTNLFIVDSLASVIDIKNNIKNYDKIISILLNSNATLPNTVLKNIKVGHL